MKTHILAAVMGTWEQGVSIVRIVVGYCIQICSIVQVTGL